MRNNDIKGRWLPGSAAEIERLGWDYIDVILFTGDAYVDHPSFGPAVIGRVIESEGLRVALVPQPNWRDDLRDFKKLGKPRLFFGVSAGNMDSMVNHYTALKRKRSDDAYTPGGRTGYRPDYPTIVYTGILKKLFPDIPVVIGGVEASMRRLAHYDYWSDSVMPSIIISSGADLLIYGMGEKPVRDLIGLLKKGIPFSSLKTINQTAFVVNFEKDIPKNKNWKTIDLPSMNEVSSNKADFSRAFVLFEKNSNMIDAARLTQVHENGIVVVNPPAQLPSITEADAVYDLPFTRLPHPRYHNKAPIPAFEMIKFSVNIHRGCFGGCSFCAIAAHQGKHVISRSSESVLREIDRISQMPGFRGIITDIGGPSANMYMMKGVDLNKCNKCSRPSCIWPSVCSNINTDHSQILDLYHKIENVEGVREFYVTSGIRYDILLPSYNKNAAGAENKYLEEIIRKHVSGRFKVAPEHTDENVLRHMRKTSFRLFEDLVDAFNRIKRKYRLNYQLVPYFISSHPACTAGNMGELAVKVKDMDIHLEPVQDFTPTPMTLSTTMYYTGTDPYSGKKVYVARSVDEKRKQNRMFFWRRRENIKDIKKDLISIGRNDIVRALYGTGSNSRKKRR